MQLGESCRQTPFPKDGHLGGVKVQVELLQGLWQRLHQILHVPVIWIGLVVDDRKLVTGIHVLVIGVEMKAGVRILVTGIHVLVIGVDMKAGVRILVTGILIDMVVGVTH